MAAAKAQGLALIGPGRLLTGLTKQVLETALEVEMGEHLGDDRGDRSASGNVRNGSSSKTVRTDIGDVRINVPRDRAGGFTPTVVPKHARRHPVELFLGNAVGLEARRSVAECPGGEFAALQLSEARSAVSIAASTREVMPGASTGRRPAT